VPASGASWAAISVGAGEIGTGAQSLSHARLLAEQVVADLDALRNGHAARLAWGEHGDRGVRAVVDGALADAEHRGDLGIALALAQQQCERRALIGWELVQSTHDV
jgi:hypothetical protein